MSWKGRQRWHYNDAKLNSKYEKQKAGKVVKLALAERLYNVQLNALFIIAFII